MQPDVTLVPVPTPLIRRVESALDRLGHASVDAFVAHAVRAALVAAEEDLRPRPDEEARIVERLRRLGYID